MLEQQIQIFEAFLISQHSFKYESQFIRITRIQQMSYFYVVFLLIIVYPSLSLIINNYFTSPNTFIQIPYTVTTMSTYINLNFTLTPTFTAAMAIIQTTNVAPSLNRQDWIHINPYSTSSYDYEGMNIGRIQYADILNPGIGTTLHIFLLSLETTLIGYYSLKVSQSNVFGMQCSSLSFYGTTPYCASCSSASYGVYCSMVYHTMNFGDTYSLSLNPVSYTPIRMISGLKNGVTVGSVAGGVILYFQFEYLANEMPGLVNYFPSSADQGCYTFTTGQTYTRLFSTGTNINLLVGLFNNNTFPVTVTISYVQEDTPNTMLILIGVLGGLLGIGVIIAIVSIVRRIRLARLAINSERALRQNQMQANQKITKKLSVDEIDFYFPTIVRSKVFPDESRFTSNKDQKNQSSQFECIICLCGIQPEDPIKVGYCKHFFHARCLTEWFNKQQSCPYCRKQYSKSNTVQLYKQLTKQREKELKGEELVLSLFRPKMNATMETLYVEDIEDMTIEQ